MKNLQSKSYIMKKILFPLIVALTIVSTQSASAWGVLGHRTIAAIAEKHLTPEAKAATEKYLKASLPSVALWMDRTASWTKKRKGHIPGYEQTSTWHTLVVDERYRVSSVQTPKGSGNLVPSLKMCVENLKNYRNLTDSAVVVNLKCIVHMVGDMHCPTHIYYLEFPDCFQSPKDANGKRTPARDRMNVYYNDKKMTYHSFWDGVGITQIYPEHSKDYNYYAKAFDKGSAKQKAKFCKGDINDWVHVSAKSCRPVYNNVKAGDHLDRDFILSFSKNTQRQCLKAGCRLAHILNECFK